MTAAATDTLPLASALVRLGRERGVTVERLRAEQTLRDARSAWAGDPADMWDRWLREAAQSVGLRCRVADLPIDMAVRLADGGALVVGGHQGDGDAIILLGASGSSAIVAEGELDAKHSVPISELEAEVGDAEVVRWLIVDHPQLTEASEAKSLAHKPVRRYWRLLRPEWSDIWIVLVFAFFAGLLSLATPIAVEALVNTVAFGNLIQPLVVLSSLLLGFLAFAAVMQALQTYVVEIIQRRLFARISADLAFRLPRVAHHSLGGAYGPELVNRFLDVVTVQKVTATLLTDGIGIILATFVGMTVLAFYHPWLLGFDVLLLICVVGGLFSLGRGAIGASIKESKLKYGLTSWFEDVMRCQTAFNSRGGAAFANDRANLLTSQYLTYRKAHFRVFWRQIVFLLGLQAVAGTVLLGVGGWLVIQQQLTLGELVAAELIVATILGSLAKLGKHLESFYDVVAAIDKLSVLFDLPVERLDGVLTLPEGKGARVRFTDVKHDRGGKSLASGFTEAIDPGERVAVYGGSGTGKSTLLRVLAASDRPKAGHVEIEHCDPRDLRPDVLRDHVTVLSEAELFNGTIAENVHLNRPGVTANDVRAALFAVGVLDDVLRLPKGIDSPTSGSGDPFSRSQRQLLVLARAFARRPRLLLIDGLLDGLPDDDLRLVLDALTDAKETWTLVVATGRRDVAEAMERTIVLDDGGDDDRSFVPVRPGGTP